MITFPLLICFGSTVPGDRPTAGWGWVQYEEGGSALGNRTGEGKGRLGRGQNNYKAEAWALLDALASIHSTTDASIYIDNYAVVQRWAGDKRGHTRGRSKEPARAVWNRLDAINTEGHGVRDEGTVGALACGGD